MNDELKQYLNEAKDSLKSLDEMKKNINALKGKVTTFEKKKDEFNENIKLTINKTLKDNKDQINKSYDEIMLEIEKRLKVSENEKQKERKKNLDNLVEKNTRINKDNNEYLLNEIKRILKDNKLPGFVNSKLYFTLFFPTSFFELLAGFIMFLIFIILIPLLIFMKFGPKDFSSLITIVKNSAFWTTLMYIAIYLLIIGIIYVFIDSSTKKDKKVLLDIKEIRKNINDNNKDIQKITRETMKNTKDEEFDYTKLDRDIEGIKYELENAKEKKREAVETFDNVTTNKIIEQINNANKDEIVNIEKELETAKEDLLNEEKKHSDLRLKISDTYETKLGKNMAIDKIDLMLNLLNKSSEEMDLTTLLQAVTKK